MILFAGSFTSAQFPDTIQLGEIEVASSVLELRKKQSGRSLTIITSEQIQQLPVHSIDEIIRYIPGLESQSRNLFGVQTDYSIRGSTFNQVLVMVDGMRLNDPLTGHFSAYIPLTLSEISRIEVVRGPASVMYGPDAVGGLINIITHNHYHKGDSLLLVNIKAGGGQQQLKYTDAGFNNSSAKIKYSGGFKLLSSDGFPEKDGFRNDFDLRTATIALSLKPSETIRLSFRTAIDSRDFSARRFYTISTADTARENISTWWNHMNVMIYGKKSVSSIDAVHRSTQDEFLFNLQTPPNKHNTGSTTIQIRNNRELLHNLRIASGFQYNYRTVKSNDRGNHKEYSGGIYSLFSFSPVKSTVLSGGIRMEYNPVDNFELLPQVNLSWNHGLFTIRGLAGKTIRTPDFTEKYISTNLTSLAPGRNIGNSDLVSEQSWSFEAGTDIDLTKDVRIELTLFNRYGYKLIDYIPTQGSEISSKHPLNPDAAYLYAKNINELTTNGLEAILSFDRKIGKQGNLYMNLGYTLQNYSSPDNLETSKYISNMSRNLFLFNTVLSYKRTGLFFNGIFRQRESEYAEMINSSLNPSYWLFNIRASMAVVPENLFLEFRMDNVLNTSYNDFLGAMLPGRWLSGGIVYRMN